MYSGLCEWGLNDAHGALNYVSYPKIRKRRETIHLLYGD